MWYILVSYHLHGRFVATHLVNFPPDLTSFYSISDMAKFCAKESSKQKESKISKTDQKSITKTGVRPLYLSPILHWFYPVKYIVSFWCSITLIEGDFKNKKTYQNKRGQQVVRLLLFTLKILTKFTANLPHKIYGQFLAW